MQRINARKGRRQSSIFVDNAFIHPPSSVTEFNIYVKVINYWVAATDDHHTPDVSKENILYVQLNSELLSTT